MTISADIFKAHRLLETSLRHLREGAIDPASLACAESLPVLARINKALSLRESEEEFLSLPLALGMPVEITEGLHKGMSGVVFQLDDPFGLVKVRTNTGTLMELSSSLTPRYPWGSREYLRGEA